jgi:hypothetical protein
VYQRALRRRLGATLLGIAHVLPELIRYLHQRHYWLVANNLKHGLMTQRDSSAQLFSGTDHREAEPASSGVH